MQNFGITKIVSGGQTGVDRAALDAAIEIGIPHGGWCPKGRLAEDGTIDDLYQLVEHSSPDYAARTRQNVIDSDGTLILYRQRMTGGTALTNRIARELGCPLLRVRLDVAPNWDRIANWISENSISVLNVAGPRGSSHPELYDDALQLLVNFFRSTPSLLDEQP
ncbi:MAG: putative molybdenum carrier protein [Aureliella sp.]